jgi:hypothetical protein
MRVPRIHQAFVACLVALLSAFVLAACGGGGGSGDGGGTGAKTGATMGVMLTDAPACGFDAIYVTVRKVRIHQRENAEEDEDGWTDVNIDPPRKINLLDLNNGVADALGEGPIGPGTYLQFRLVLVPNSDGVLANSVVRSGTTRELPLTTPSGSRSGIKLIHGFTVGQGQRADVLLDFNACRSVIKLGHGHRHENREGKGLYVLVPVIKITPFLVDTAGIKGVIAPAMLGSNVVVSAQRDGVILQSTAPNPQTGEFTLARMDAGNYDVVVTADGHASALIRGVPVTSSSSTASIGTSAQPFTLPASATHTISGTITLTPVSAATVVTVSASQTIAAGTLVQIQSDDADLADGSYTMTLPVAAPLVGNYGAGTLPISLAPVPTAAGQYFIQASAAGYTTQSITRNLSAADVTQNANLVP